MYTVAGRVVEEPGDWILREIDIAAEMGVEAFMVDAGWYGGKFAGWPEQRGDWARATGCPAAWPASASTPTSKGLLFGLWHEAEAVSDKSQLYTEHPDWMLQTDDDRACAETLDLANPEAARFFEDTVLRIMREVPTGFLQARLQRLRRARAARTVRDGYAESEFWRHHEVLYRTYDRVLQRDPRRSAWRTAPAAAAATTSGCSRASTTPASRTGA